MLAVVAHSELTYTTHTAERGGKYSYSERQQHTESEVLVEMRKSIQHGAAGAGGTEEEVLMTTIHTLLLTPYIDKTQLALNLF